MDQVKLSVVVAVYNESPYNLHTLIERLNKVLTVANISYEVVFVNDGSKEETSECLVELCRQNNYAKLVNFSRNFGQQAAISAGINFASGQAIVSIDSDLQDPPELIPDMVNLWERGFDVVYAKRTSRQDRLIKQSTAFLFYRILSVLSDIKIPEDTGEFRLLDKRVAKALQLLPERTRYLRGLIPWLGFKQTTIPINRSARHHGESTYTLRKLTMLALDGIICFSYAPLYAISIIGLAIIVVSFIVPVIWFLVHHGLGLTVLLIAGAGLLFGLQILLSGILGLYLAKIFDEVRARPTYVVSDLVGESFSGIVQKSNASEFQLEARNRPGIRSFASSKFTSYSDNLTAHEESTEQSQ